MYGVACDILGLPDVHECARDDMVEFHKWARTPTYLQSIKNDHGAFANDSPCRLDLLFPGHSRHLTLLTHTGEARRYRR